MVFALLAKVVVFHLQITIMKIRVPGLERLIAVIPASRIVLSLFIAGFYELLEQLVGENLLGSGRRSESRLRFLNGSRTPDGSPMADKSHSKKTE